MAMSEEHSLEKGSAALLLAAFFKLESDKHGQMLKSLQVLRQSHWPFRTLHIAVVCVHRHASAKKRFEMDDASGVCLELFLLCNTVEKALGHAVNSDLCEVCTTHMVCIYV